MSQRLYLACLAWIASTYFCGCQDVRIDRRTGMEVVEKPWPAWAVAFSPDGRWLAAGRGYRSKVKLALGGKGEVNVWKVEDWKQQDGFTAPFTTYVEALTFTPDSKHLIAAATQYIQTDPKTGGPVVGTPNPHDGNVVYVWSVLEGSVEGTHHFDDPRDIRSDGYVSALEIHPDGELLGLSLMGSSSVVLQEKTGHLAYEVGKNNGYWENLVFSPDGKTLALALRSSVQLCDASTGKERVHFDLKGEGPICLCFSGDGKQIAVGMKDGTVRLLAAGLTKQLRSLQISSDKEWVVGITSAPKMDLLAAATPSRVRLFETSTGKQLQEWGKPDLKAFAVALSPDGKLLAVGYGGKHNAEGERRGGYVNIWDTATGRLIKKLD